MSVAVGVDDVDKRVHDLKEAYALAKACPGTVELTGMPVFRPEELELPQGANVLLFNDGEIGRAHV